MIALTFTAWLEFSEPEQARGDCAMSRLADRIIATVLTILTSVLPASAFQTDARSLIIVDHASGMVLAEKNADEPLPPASMSKLMTLNMVFEALREGRLSLADKLPVSQHAASYGGSSMFLKRGELVSVEDLLRGVVVLSGNDSSAVLAEALSPDGTEAGFAQLMNRRALELGLTNSRFTNANGWPDPNHKMTARDLALLASRLIREFPEYYVYFAEEEFLFDERVPENRYNRNPLLKLGRGADGLKTGYTRDSGYGLVGSASNGKRRVVFVIAGLKSRTERTEKASQIVNWYFIQFSERSLFSAGETVVEAPVWMGSENTVAAVVPGDAFVLVPGSASNVEIRAEATFERHLEAPIAQGEPVGKLVVSHPGPNYTTTFPLVAGQSVERAGYLDRFVFAARTMVSRLIAGTFSGD